MYILPKPEKVSWKENQYCLKYDTGIVIDAKISAKDVEFIYEYARLLQQEILESTGLKPAIRREHFGKVKGEIHLTCSGTGESGDESYSLQIEEAQIVIAAGTTAGVLYGVQTLRQIFRQAGAVLPCVEIADAPKIADRGLSYDVTRGRVPTLEELKRQADFCSFYKMNQLQLYVEHSYMFREFSEMWRYNTPLTAEEIMELDAYCKKLHIELIPSLASFGHMYEVLHTKSYAHLCELENSDKDVYSLVGRMAHHTVDVSNPDSFSMVTARIEEFMGLFSSSYFNICADETFDLCKGRSKALGEEKGVKRVYLEFLNRLCDFLMERGKIPMFWGDVLIERPELLSELPENAVLLNWEYGPHVTEDNVKILSDAGVKNLYLCPGVQSWNHLINKHSDAYANISGMCRNAHKYGARGVLNTEWGDLGHIAHSEFSSIGQIYGAAFSWSDSICEEEEINRAISVIQYGDRKEAIVALFRELADMETVNWWHAVQYKEQHNLEEILFTGSEESAEDRLRRADAFLQGNEAVLQKLYAVLAELPERTRRDVSAYILMGEGQKLLTMTGKVLCEHGAGEKLSCDCKELAVKWEYWLAEYGKLWRSVAKESELFRVTEIISWYADLLRDLVS